MMHPAPARAPQVLIVDDVPANLLALEATFPKRSDAVHIGAGFGASFSKWGQIDVAIDISPRVNTFSVSTVINRFRW